MEDGDNQWNWKRCVLLIEIFMYFGNEYIFILRINYRIIHDFRDWSEEKRENYFTKTLIYFGFVVPCCPLCPVVARTVITVRATRGHRGQQRK
jgi:hypothetical protein